MFNDDLGELGLTTKGIEEVLLLETPEFKGQNRNNKIEWEVKIPPIVPIFYSFIHINGRIPTQSELLNTYMQQNLSEFNEDDLLAIETRVRSAYPSLVRDVYFYCLLKESGKFQEVIYNQDADLRHDADIIVKNYDMWFGLALYLKSNRSDRGRYKKEKRHIRLPELTYIEVPFILQGSKQVNKINLYGYPEELYVLYRTRYYKLISNLENQIKGDNDGRGIKED
jgi:hypothetical protein